MASELTKPFEEKMKKTLTALDSDYGTIRAGRANPHVLDKIMEEEQAEEVQHAKRPYGQSSHHRGRQEIAQEKQQPQEAENQRRQQQGQTTGGQR